MCRGGWTAVKDMPQFKAPKEAVIPNDLRLEKDPVRAAVYDGEIQNLVESSFVTKLDPATLQLLHPGKRVMGHTPLHGDSQYKNQVVFNCSYQLQGQNLN